LPNIASNITALKDIVSNVNVNSQTNPSLYKEIQSLKTQISNYLNGNGSLPVVTPTLAGTLVSNLTVDPKTNPTL